MDSVSTGLTHSPSSTPPKKTWERNYKSFLKKSGGGGGIGSTRQNINSHTPLPAMLPAPRLPSGGSKLIHSKRSSVPAFPTNSDLGKAAELAAADSGDVEFGVNDDWATNPPNHQHSISSVPSSPIKPHKEHSLRGGSFFRKLRSKTKSEDSLDSTMRKGRERRGNSPTTTPPGSDASLSSRSKHSPTTKRRIASIKDGLEKAAILSETLGTPVLGDISPLPLIPDQSQGATATAGMITTEPLKDGSNKSRKSRSRGFTSDENNSLDGAMHRGHHTTSVTNGVGGGGGKSKLSMPSFNRVKSMTGGLTIKEGEPTVISNEQEALMREKRKAFTDFHNMGVDSTSAFLGDESSNHRNSFFLSTVAYPSNTRVMPSNTTRGGAQSYDKKTTISPSTSANALTTKGSPQDELDNSTGIATERALRPVRGPESWKKGERHSIIPAILCVCPFQVLSKIMSDDSVNPPSGVSSGQSLLSSSPVRGYGIGSMISDDEHNDSVQNGWFFADHNQSQPLRSSITTSVPPSAFGKIMLGKATVAALGVRSFFNEVYGWTSGIFVLRQNYLFEYRDDDNQKGLPWGYAHLQLAEAYPHKHFVNALHLDFFEKPCSKSGKRSLLLRVEDKGERDRWVSLLQAAARTTIHDLYDVDVNGGPEFGRGRYAVVRPARRRQTRRVSSSHDGLRLVSSGDNLSGASKDVPDSGTGYDCALKIINKKEFWSRVKKGAERADTLVREAAVQTTLAVQGSATPGFLKLRSIFETGEEIVLELELLKGTDLFQHVSSRGTLDEVEAAQVMRDLLQCLDVMDQLGIAHRDIKPANLLMCDENCGSGCKIKMADFGMASFVGVDNLVRGRCGTPGFVAPEILRTAVNSGYGNKVDMFSAGVTLYVMLAGYEPFYGESDAELISANREAKVDFPNADWHKISVEGRDLIEKMLIADPLARISPADALRHPWITRRAVN